MYEVNCIKAENIVIKQKMIEIKIEKYIGMKYNKLQVHLIFLIFLLNF